MKSFSSRKLSCLVLLPLLCSILSACGGEDTSPARAASSTASASAAATNASSAGNQPQPPAMHCAP
ncbi:MULTISPECIES: hypothetical protein [unclassified Iodobacter]|uniref:hypothetical protein n=1 Tax=unclassified Iodobacter TaxID=235634 RepID=UPI0025E6EFC4|nr:MULTISPECIES: hypothetical protein [unclassified Iodobacter]MDW5416540.1 hypothetical protein [Iodobacter sp. CM08]